MRYVRCPEQSGYVAHLSTLVISLKEVSKSVIYQIGLMSILQIDVANPVTHVSEVSIDILHLC